ncbi:hypothetical protein V2G26_001892 [Clonostachys chloroleuca]
MTPVLHLCLGLQSSEAVLVGCGFFDRQSKTPITITTEPLPPVQGSVSPQSRSSRMTAYTKPPPLDPYDNPDVLPGPALTPRPDPVDLCAFNPNLQPQDHGLILLRPRSPLFSRQIQQSKQLLSR